MNFLNFLKPKITVATHNGSFHADEVFGCAVLSLWAEKKGKRIKIIRTRDKTVIDTADIVLDVGMTYEPEKNRYDHHQKEGAGNHENGVPYASFGLIWKHFGEKITSKKTAEIIENDLVIPVDARDNGIRISNPIIEGIIDYRANDALCSFNTTWQESEKDTDKNFYKALYFAKEILRREIDNANAKIEGNRLTKLEIEKQNKPSILILDTYFNWSKEVSKVKEIKFVVYKHKNGRDWCIQSGRDDIEDFKSDRANMPKNWGGLRDEELAKISGIADAIFCANGGWFGVAKSKEGALAMGQKALAMASKTE